MKKTLNLNQNLYLAFFVTTLITTFITSFFIGVHKSEASLSVSCYPSTSSAFEGENVKWNSYVYGTTGSTTYSWSGSDGLTGSSTSVTKSYSSDGTKNATLNVVSGGQNVTANCNSVTIKESSNSNYGSGSGSSGSGYNYGSSDGYDYGQDLQVICRVSRTEARVNEEVVFEAYVYGGNPPYEYDWFGDVNGDDRTERVKFKKTGEYEAEIEVEDDDGDEESDECEEVEVTTTGGSGGSSSGYDYTSIYNNYSDIYGGGSTYNPNSSTGNSSGSSNSGSGNYNPSDPQSVQNEINRLKEIVIILQQIVNDLIAKQNR